MEAVNQAQKKQKEAEEQARFAECQAERERKQADVKIQKTRKNAKREINNMKEKQFFWDWGYITVIIFSLIQNGAFQRDILRFIRTLVKWCVEYGTWFVHLDYMGYSAGEVWFERIFTMVLIAFGVIGSILLIWAGIEQYKKRWDDVYKMVLLGSISFIAVLGNTIRVYISINLIFIFLFMNIGTLILRIYLSEKLMD